MEEDLCTGQVLKEVIRDLFKICGYMEEIIIKEWRKNSRQVFRSDHRRGIGKDL
jgi:hypothetical protein